MKTDRMASLRLTRLIVTLTVLTAIVLGIREPSTMAFVPPPNGDGVEQLYADNINGSDQFGDGSKDKPYATISKTLAKANNSGAPTVRINVAATKTSYILDKDLAPKRDRIQFVGYNGRPVAIGKPQSGGLARFDIQDIAGVVVQGFDLQDIGVRIRAGLDTLVDNNRFTVSNPSPYSQLNQAAVISVVYPNYDAGDELDNKNISISANQVFMKYSGTTVLSAIRMDGTSDSLVFDNSLSPSSPTTARAVVYLVNSSGDSFGGNKYTLAGYYKTPVYKVDQASSSNFFDHNILK